LLAPLDLSSLYSQQTNSVGACPYINYICLALENQTENI
jgi:hypothetical protein